MAYPIYIISIITIIIFPILSFGWDVKLGWNQPTQGNPTGYKIYVGFPSGNYTSEIDVGNITEYIIDLPNGRYFAAAKAYNDTELSDYSNEIVFVVNDGAIEEKTRTQRQSSGLISGGSIPAP